MRAGPELLIVAIVVKKWREAVKSFIFKPAVFGGRVVHSKSRAISICECGDSEKLRSQSRSLM
jgi:hypothetical protein